MMKKRLAFVLAVCLAGSLMGCGNSGNGGGGQSEGESSGEKKVISFYSWSENSEQDFDKAIIAQYEKEHSDVDVEEVFVPYSEYLSCLLYTSDAADD